MLAAEVSAMKTVTCHRLGRAAVATLALLVMTGAAACAGSGSTAKTAATGSAAVNSATSPPSPASTEGLRLFRRADPDAVAIADKFIAAYNQGRHALSRFWDFSGASSSRWADNAYLRPHCLTEVICTAGAVRVSPVFELGKFQKTDLPGQQPAPVLLAFQVDYDVFGTPTWILEFSADGRHVVNLWVP
jgi:hypothetical protein